MTNIDTLQKENAELKRQLEERRFGSFINFLYLVNILAITTQKWDTWLLYFFTAELAELFIWLAWASFWDSRRA